MQKGSVLAKILVIIGILAAVAYGCYGYFFPAKGMDNLAREDRLSLKKNIVVLGVDERQEEYDVGRSDTLFVMMFDTKNKNVSLLSIPRDTRVKIKNHGWDKINHAYAYGGRELTQETVEEFLGLRIDNYIMVDFKGFKGLVDAIGGVDINVEKDMYYKDTWDGFTIDLEKGMQHMDGKTAIQYVRYRDEEGDIGRIKRQQHFIKAVYEKITSADMLLRIPGLTKQLSSMIKTNLSLTVMAEIGKALSTMMKNQGLVMATVPGEGEYIDDISYWLPDIKETRKLMMDMQGGVMNDRYWSAAETMASEYSAAIAKAKKGDTSEENKEALKKEKEQQKKKDALNNKNGKYKKKIDTTKKTDNSQNGASNTTATTASVRRAVTVRVVNCSGNSAAGGVAIARLRAAGFAVQNGGSGSSVVANTTVTSTTNNGTVVNKLSSIPFAHQLRITRDGAADCDGVIVLGKDFQ